MNTNLMASGGIATFHGQAWISRIIMRCRPPKKPGNLGLSHVAILPPQRFWRGPDPILWESTRWNGVSGPQINFLAPRLAGDYHKKGCHSWLLPFDLDHEPDWDRTLSAVNQLVGLRKAGKLHYNIKELFSDAVESIPGHEYILPLDLIDDIGKCDQDDQVCSHFVVDALTVGGLRFPFQGWGCSPEQIRDLPWYLNPVQIL